MSENEVAVEFSAVEELEEAVRSSGGMLTTDRSARGASLASTQSWVAPKSP